MAAASIRLASSIWLYVQLTIFLPHSQLTRYSHVNKRGKFQYGSIDLDYQDYCQVAKLLDDTMTYLEHSKNYEYALYDSIRYGIDNEYLCILS